MSELGSRSLDPGVSVPGEDVDNGGYLGKRPRSSGLINGKRSRKGGVMSSFPDEVRQGPIVPRFLIVSGTESTGSFTKVNPFKIHKELVHTCGTLKNVKKLRNGALLVECSSDLQSTALQARQTLCGIPIKVEAHRSLNYTKGVITCRDFLNVDIEEIKTELKACNVVDARFLTTKRNGEIVNTASIVLTFQSLTLPKVINASFYSLPVRAYYPLPTLCYNCGNFGHVRNTCKSPKTVCLVCGKDKHDGACVSPTLCINCQGDHPTFSRQCPKYADEKSIIEIKINEKLSYGEARKKFDQIKAPTFSRSFASVAATAPLGPKACGCVCQHTITNANNSSVTTAYTVPQVSAQGRTPNTTVLPKPINLQSRGLREVPSSSLPKQKEDTSFANLASQDPCRITASSSINQEENSGMVSLGTPIPGRSQISQTDPDWVLVGRPPASPVQSTPRQSLGMIVNNQFDPLSLIEDSEYF